MSEYTKKGLLFLMISVIFSIVGTVVITVSIYNLFNTLDLDTFSLTEGINLLLTIIPGTIIAIIVAVFMIIYFDEIINSEIFQNTLNSSLLLLHQVLIF